MPFVVCVTTHFEGAASLTDSTCIALDKDQYLTLRWQANDILSIWHLKQRYMMLCDLSLIVSLCTVHTVSLIQSDLNPSSKMFIKSRKLDHTVEQLVES